MEVADWKASVIRACEEVVGHPFGGKVEVFVVVDERGVKTLNAVPYLAGRSKRRTTIESCDD